MGLLCAAMLFWAGAALAQTPGASVVTYRSDIDDTDQPYSLYVPRGYNASRQYPLVVALHGPFSNHRLTMRRVFGKGGPAGEDEAEASRSFPQLPDVDFVVACPLARGTMGFHGIAERDVYDVLADVRSRLSIDPDRIYLTGLSSGGGGALWLALTRPDIWAAVAVVSPQAMAGTAELAPNAVNLPIRLFHGTRDPVVPVAEARAWRDSLKAAGARVEYTEYRDGRHNVWDAAYHDAAIFRWFAPFRRNRFPDHVNLRTRRYRYHTAFWVSITRLYPGEGASIDAEFAGENRVEVRSKGVSAFNLTLTGHPRFTPGKPVSVTIDGQRVTGLAFRRVGQTWSAGPAPEPSGKRPGMEGPISEAFSSRHIYVYGTLDNPPASELERRRQQAEAASKWSSTRIRTVTGFHVAADRDVTGEDAATANLILFGTRETNRLIERYSGSLPLVLDASAADYGLFYVWPNGSRYLAISSGIPFYTGVDRVRRGAPAFLNSPFALTETLGDFLLFRGSLENVIFEGSFDDYWRLSAEAEMRLRQAGVLK